MSDDVRDAAVARQDAGAWAADATRWATSAHEIRLRSTVISIDTGGRDRRSAIDRAGWLLEQAAADLANAAKRAATAAKLLDGRQPRVGPPRR